MDSLVTTLLDGLLVPLITLVTAPVAFLASSGALLPLFAVLWIVLGVAIVRAPARVDDAWRRLRALPTIVQLVVWLVLLPILAGVWIWRTRWPGPARATAVVVIACWNLLVFLPVPG